MVMNTILRHKSLCRPFIKSYQRLKERYYEIKIFINKKKKIVLQ